MIKGIIPMTYCFFNKNNTIDLNVMHEQISLIKKLGSNGIACLGLATEVNKLDFVEKKNINNALSNNFKNFPKIKMDILKCPFFKISKNFLKKIFKIFKNEIFIFQNESIMV